ncbi:MAG: hypothetical protein F4X02_10345 [Chloroflexi bacterium]|nr:hypothetical protein [Chloroflexota bacterium]
MLDRYFYTFHNPAGNRFVRGGGRFPDVQAIDIPLRGAPAWAVGYAMETAVWHVVLRNGDLQVVEVAPDGAARTLTFESGWFAPAQPPLVGVSMIEGAYVLRGDASVSALTHPIPVNDFEALYINRDGDLVLGREDGERARLPIAAQPDARLVMNSRGQVALYANATDQRYTHGIMGDLLEAATLLVIEALEGRLRLLARVDLPGADVYEGIAPFWADVDGDGVEDLVTTVSNGSLGARLRAYLWDGAGIRQEADSPPIGQGNRWRHQLSAAPFGPAGEIEIAATLTPNIAGALEFFHFSGGALEQTVRFPGVTTHALGSRNLDQTAAGDFNGDGRPEVLAMDAARRAVVAVQRDDKAGAREVWRLDADSEIVSNFAPVELLDGGLALAVGVADRRLRVWLPRG